MLLAILVMMTLMVIAALAVAPALATQIKRQREEELIHRGSEYAKAIRRFYRKFGRYPTSVEQLENTNNFRFLRKRYKDPITGKDDWKLIHFGEAKNPLNLFGAASSGTGSAATGTGGISSPGFGTPTQPPPGTPAGQPAAATGQPAGATGQPGQPTSGGSSSFGQTFGGGPIIGVVSPSKAESLKELQGKTHYDEWEFVYDPRFDRQGQGAGGTPALPGMGTPPGLGTPAGAQPPGQSNPPTTAPPPANPFSGPQKPPS
jgi:type II secretory pathway pseudopilin PulG